jgi:L-alanine-DL-glutamate epimerase-like enolase superfamily enzyme
MRINRFDIVIVELPKRLIVEVDSGESKSARKILVAARDEDGNAGWGESCPHPDVTGETIQSARDDLQQSILPDLIGRRFGSLYDVVAVMSGAIEKLPRNQYAAFCAAELAVLDLVSRHLGVSAGEAIGPIRKGAVHYSGVIPTGSREVVQKYAARMRKLAVGHVKIKVGSDLTENLDFLDIARQILGDEVEFRINADGAWNSDEAIRQLRAMSLYRLAGVEQPVPSDDIQGMARVTAEGNVPVIADTSLVTLDDARQLAKANACDVFNIGISKCGGLINSSRIHAVARSAGLGCQLGARSGETGLLSAAGRQYATRNEGAKWCEGSIDNEQSGTKITQPDIAATTGGLATAINEPGMGVTVLEDQVARHATTRITVR